MGTIVPYVGIMTPHNKQPLICCGLSEHGSDPLGAAPNQDVGFNLSHLNFFTHTEEDLRRRLSISKSRLFHRAAFHCPWN